MGQTHTFSIYLLKEGYCDDSALKDGHELENDIGSKALPEGASLYVLDNPANSPWWKGYFGIEKDLRQTLKAAVVFLPVGDRTFVITFGHVRHNLRDVSYEYDFGLRVTLNCLDPEKLKSTDILNPNGAKRQRTQSPIDSDLTFFDFDRDTTILKSLTGKVLEKHKEFFKHATGGSSIRISSDIGPNGLPELCKTLLKLYDDDTYKKTFPDIQNISPVRDPEIIDALNAKLISDFRAKQDGISLSVPEILNYQDGLWASFSGAGLSDIYDDVFIGRYFTYLEGHEVSLDDIELEQLKRHCLVLTDEEGNPKGERHSIYKCLIYDTVLDDESETYHLCDGNWYLVDTDFVSKLSAFLDPFCANTEFPDFTHVDEGEFNESVAEDIATCLCLDKKSIAPAGQSAVEPCDIFEVKNGKAILHHIKISTLSASLSHLFNQGTNSIHLIRDDDEARGRLRSLVSEIADDGLVAGFVAPIDADSFKVVFGIITHKKPENKSLNLPLFSRISLMRVMKDLKRMGIDAEYCFINDITEVTPGKKKKRKPRKKSDIGEENGKSGDAA